MFQHWWIAGGSDPILQDDNIKNRTRKIPGWIVYLGIINVKSLLWCSWLLPSRIYQFWQWESSLCLTICYINSYPMYRYAGGRMQERRRNQSIIIVFYFSMIIQYLALKICVPPPTAIRWSLMVRFWYSGYQNNHSD